MPDFEGVQFFF